MQSWQKGLRDLRSSFERYFDSDLHVFIIQYDGTEDSFDPKWVSAGTGPLELPPSECWRGEMPIIDDACASYEANPAKPGLVRLQRRVFFGCDASRLSVFLETATAAGSCIEGISRDGWEKRDWALRWINYVIELTRIEVVGSPLRLKPVSTPIFTCLSYHQKYLLPATNVFRASAWAIDTILEHLGTSESEGQRMEDEKAPKSPTQTIPSDRRTRPMTLSEAAKLMGYKSHQKGKQKGKQPAENLKRAMIAGAIAFEKRGRSSYVFDREDFPPESQKAVGPS